MKHTHIKDVTPIKFNGGYSYRFVLEKNKIGFAMMETRIKKGGEYFWHYKKHQEACFCIEGSGFVKKLETNEVIKIEKGVCYMVDNHQAHEFTAVTDVVLISVFNPPLKGNETHDESGNYN